MWLLHQPSNQDRRSTDRLFAATRRGLTLVELLVVIAVLVTLTAILIPSVRFLTKDRQIREAVREIDAFIATAQTEAMRTGQAGIWIERDQNSPNTSTRIYKLKAPPYYTGDFANSGAWVTNTGSNSVELQIPYNGLDDDGNAVVDDHYVATVTFRNSASALSLVRRGDLVQLDLKGPWYVVTSDPVPGLFGFPSVQVTHKQSIPPTYPPAPPMSADEPGVPFRVLRQPQRESTAYLDLPAGTMLDLSKSGFTVLDRSDFAPDTYSFGNELNGGTAPVMLIFGKDGGLDTVIAHQLPFAPDRSLHLLLAADERELSDEIADSGLYKAPLNSESSYWISINRQGAVSTAENSPVEYDTDRPTSLELRAARSLTRTMETSGGG